MKVRLEKNSGGKAIWKQDKVLLLSFCALALHIKNRRRKD